MTVEAVCSANWPYRFPFQVGRLRGEVSIGRALTIKTKKISKRGRERKGKETPLLSVITREDVQKGSKWVR